MLGIGKRSRRRWTAFACAAFAAFCGAAAGIAACGASACGGKAVIDGHPGGFGGAGGAAMSSSTNATTSASNSQTVGVVTGGPTETGATASASTGGCTDMAGCGTCRNCLQKSKACGFPSGMEAMGLCHCNHGGMGQDSYDRYAAAFDCICGPDGKGGLCGAHCGKTCDSQGSDDDLCAACLTKILQSMCAPAINACIADN